MSVWIDGGRIDGWVVDELVLGEKIVLYFFRK